MNHRQLAIAAVLAAGAAAPSMAQQNTLKRGISNVQPQSSASDISGPFTLGGVGTEVRGKTTPFVSCICDISKPRDAERAISI